MSYADVPTQAHASHALEADPPFFSAAERWTCAACGLAVLRRERIVYGQLADGRPCTKVSIDDTVALSPRDEGAFMDKKVSARVDMAYTEATADEAAKNMSDLHEVEVKVVDPIGPASGWPVVEVTGTDERVRHALADGWGLERDEIDALLG